MSPFLLSQNHFCFSLFHGHCSASLMSEVLEDVHPFVILSQTLPCFLIPTVVLNFYVDYAVRICMISKRCTGCLVSMDELSLLRSRGSAFSELFIHSWLMETSRHFCFFKLGSLLTMTCLSSREIVAPLCLCGTNKSGFSSLMLHSMRRGLGFDHVRNVFGKWVSIGLYNCRTCFVVSQSGILFHLCSKPSFLSVYYIQALSSGIYTTHLLIWGEMADGKGKN